MAAHGLLMGHVLTQDYATRKFFMKNKNQNLVGLASVLTQLGLLSNESAQQAQENAQVLNMPFISYVVKNHLVASDAILKHCANFFDLTIFDLKNYEKKWLHESKLSLDFVRQYHAVPLKIKNQTLQLGLSDPTRHEAVDAAGFFAKMSVKIVLVAEDALQRLIDMELNAHAQKKLELISLKELADEENLTHVHEKITHYDEPLIQFVNQLIQNALHQNASDIHIEPFQLSCRIRFRLDGVLQQITEIPSNLAARLATRLKVMAKLDITERRLPQDGRFQIHFVDVRISTCPVLHGEKIVLRILDTKKTALGLDELGLLDTQKEQLLQALNQPQGLILVTGPTGSGKTVTLYSALQYLNHLDRNISTVEDPVEIQLHGINQVNINTKINLHFSTTLRALLRQDPDVLMVGEIRDPETAEIAIQAAHTGHLVLATLHTNSAAEAVTRLQAMGIAGYRGGR